MEGFDGAAFGAGLGWCALGVAVLMAATFVLARRLGKHSVVDVSWGLGFVVVALVTYLVAGDAGAESRQLLVTAMVLVWGGRLAWHIGGRNAGHGEDPRYQALLARASPGRQPAYAIRMIYAPQGALILFISLPVQANAYARDEVGVLAALGVALWAVGLLFEAVGDRQLKVFKADPANKGQIMDRGLWRYTRHPNYFGDACVWWGIFGVAAETGAGAFTVASPVVMTLLLTKGSGAALTERRMKDRPGYADYRARTSGFLPRPPRRG